MEANKLSFRLLVPLFTIIFIIILKSTAADDHDQLALPGCRSRCGDVDIPYPFGLSEDCYLNRKFRIKCENNTTPINGKNAVVTNISVKFNEITINLLAARSCYNESGDQVDYHISGLRAKTLTISGSKNNFIVLGCDSYAFLNGFENGTKYSMGCMSTCNALGDVPDDGGCSGIGCCQIDLPKGRLKRLIIRPKSFFNHTRVMSFNPCTYAFIVQKNGFNFSREFLGNFPAKKLPVVADWTIEKDTSCSTTKARNDSFCACGGNSTVVELSAVNGSETQYKCRCKDGYEGNPYLPTGCRDIDECLSLGPTNCTKTQHCVNKPEGSYTCVERSQFPLIKICIGVAIGFVALFISSSWLYLVLKQRKLMQLKEKFFKQNGGLILKQKLSGQEGNSSSTAKIFTEEELIKATLNYDESTIIDRGGFGTVYKGFLPDERIIAIKKSKLIDQNQTEQFINEVVVLSQINHKNIVKLLGCCLETQVPLLVYEFVPNGTLSEHIHDREKSIKLSWETRLGIAAEAAEALAYLHSAASTPIIHRDVKPSNILLDNFTAKVSDFGASKLVPQDQVELATMVQGTLGYLDPEYLQTNQLTEKSDVYSFGVVLVELLTAKKAISFDRLEEERSLAMHFLCSLKRDRLFEIVEVEGDSANNYKEQVLKVAMIAKGCLSVNGEDRPSMKEVAVELEGLRKVEKHPWASEDDRSIDHLEETVSLLAREDNDNGGSNANSVYDSIRDQVLLDFSGR
ncbi:putative wall-associated receptor kinase-like 16 [Humulus lupulus]|uniref:putative wall-associated receptor kinase-like 16 n=1 Tax=Humulus lupulus TaxID=3486 RepID=UPI002B41515C|nr:putative wall-associated receptor kinase-like 16 [Humulus lupulus]